MMRTTPFIGQLLNIFFLSQNKFHQLYIYSDIISGHSDQWFFLYSILKVNFNYNHPVFDIYICIKDTCIRYIYFLCHTLYTLRTYIPHILHQYIYCTGIILHIYEDIHDAFISLLMTLVTENFKLSLQSWHNHKCEILL